MIIHPYIKGEYVMCGLFYTVITQAGKLVLRLRMHLPKGSLKSGWPIGTFPDGLSSGNNARSIEVCLNGGRAILVVFFHCFRCHN